MNMTLQEEFDNFLKNSFKEHIVTKLQYEDLRLAFFAGIITFVLQMMNHAENMEDLAPFFLRITEEVDEYMKNEFGYKSINKRDN